MKLKTLIKAIVIFACVAFTTPIYIGMAKSDLETPSSDWNDALLWIRDNTSANATILAWWDYGYWIEYRAERAPYLTPSQEFNKIPFIASLFLSYDERGPLWIVDYVIIDREAALNMIRSMAIWAGLDYRDIDRGRTLVRRLYEKEQVPGYKLVYENDELVIYKIVRENPAF